MQIPQDTAPQEISGPFVRFFIRLLPYFLPRAGQRTVFLTTLILELVNSRPELEDVLDELNTKLGIVKDEAALAFPKSIHKDVWSGRELIIRNPNQQLSARELEGLAMRIIRTLPEWSHYGFHQDVLQDTCTVVEVSLQKTHQLCAPVLREPKLEA